MRIDEPLIALTDIIVSVFCFLFFFKIQKTKQINKVVYLFKYYFLTLGIGLLIGGIIGHAFLYKFEIYWKLAGWIPCMISVVIIVWAVIEHSSFHLNSRLIVIMKVLNLLFFLCFFTLANNSVNFKYVVIHSFLGYVFFVFFPEVYLFIKTKNSESSFLMLGVFFAACAGITYSLKISFGYILDYMTISHLMILFTVISFNEGIKRIILSNVTIEAK